MPIVQCPKCRAELDVERSDLGHTVECPQCQAVFPAVAEERGWRRDRDGGDDDRDDYELERGRLDRVRDEELARKTVGAPARALMIASVIMSVLAGLIAVGLLIGGVYVVNQPVARGAPNQGEPAIMLFIYGVWALFGTVFSGFIGFAASKARDPHKTAWGYVASIMGFTTIIFCHFCNPYTWCAVGFGIWLLIAMNKPEVQRYVRWSKRPSSQHRGSPLGDVDAPH